MQVASKSFLFLFLVVSFLLSGSVLFENLGYGLSSVQVISVLMLVYFCLAAFSRTAVSKKDLFLAAFLLSVFFLYLPFSAVPVIEQAKYLAVLFPVLVLSSYDTGDFGKAFLWASACYVVLAIVLFWFGVGHSETYGFARMQGLLSEPSALALPIAAVFLLALLRKSLVLFVVGILGSAMAQSVMIVLVSILSIFVYIVISYERARERILALLVAFISILIFIFVASFVTMHGFVLGRMQQGFESLLTVGETGYNPRFNHALEFFSWLHSSGGLVFGKGLNGAYHFSYDTDAMRSLSLPFEILANFGVVGLILFLFLVFYILLCMRFDREVSAAFSVLLSYCFLNSAMGITFHLLLAALFLSMWRHDVIKCHSYLISSEKAGS